MQPAEPLEPQIHIEPDKMAGVYANWAQVGHSPYEFTIDFVRLDFSSNPPQGIVVSRVSLSPLLVSQLIDALGTNWSRYVEKAMPAEAWRQQHGAEGDPDAGGESAASGDEPGGDDHPAG